MTVETVTWLFVGWCLLSVPLGIGIGKFIRGPR